MAPDEAAGAEVEPEDAVAIATDPAFAAAVKTVAAEDVGAWPVAALAVPKETSAVKAPTAMTVWFACTTAAVPLIGPLTTPVAVAISAASMTAAVPV